MAGGGEVEREVAAATRPERTVSTCGRELRPGRNIEDLWIPKGVVFLTAIAEGGP